MKTLILDNYDSFTYNLYQYLGELGGQPSVYRNDRISVEEARDQQFSHIVIGPGPGSPYVDRDIGVSHELIRYAEQAGIPLLGVCLGHQVLAVHYGGHVSRAPQLYHGKSSRAVLLEPPAALFEGLASPLEVMRYHSLRVEEPSLPKTLRVTARSVEDGSVMAMEHVERQLWGVQFHPESIGTPDGKRILRRFLDLPQKDEAGPRGLVLGQQAAPLASVALLAARHGSDERTVVRVGRDCSIGKEGPSPSSPGRAPSNPSRSSTGPRPWSTATACTSCAAAPSNPAPVHIASRAWAWRGCGCCERSPSSTGWPPSPRP